MKTKLIGTFITIIATAAVTLAIGANAVHAKEYKWTVTFPNDLQIPTAFVEPCLITFYADKGKESSELMTLKKGKTISWKSKKPLSQVAGGCNRYMQPMSCKGSDLNNISQYGPECSYDINSVVCLKPDPTNPFLKILGFCLK